MKVTGKRPDPLVLNAFRHHWNSHLIGSGVLCCMTLVLNAFRHHWNSHLRRGNRCQDLLCAQRLSASLEFALPRFGEPVQF